MNNTRILSVRGFNLEDEMSKYHSLEGDWEDVDLPKNSRRPDEQVPTVTRSLYVPLGELVLMSAKRIKQYSGMQAPTTTETGVNPDDDVRVVIFGAHREARRRLLSRHARLYAGSPHQLHHALNAGKIPEDRPNQYNQYQ